MLTREPTPSPLWAAQGAVGNQQPVGAVLCDAVHVQERTRALGGKSQVGQTRPAGSERRYSGRQELASLSRQVWERKVEDPCRGKTLSPTSTEPPSTGVRVSEWADRLTR
jgi:hypothetical protein